MNSDDPRFELARRYVEGAVSDDDARTLEAALREDAAFRHEFLRYLNIDAALGSVAVGRLFDDSAASDRPTSRFPRHRHPRTVRRRRAVLALAMVAGFVVGLVGTSLVWAMSAARLTAEAETRSLLVEGFEGPPGPIQAGFPAAAGQWSGDKAEIVAWPGSEDSAGRQVLRFDAAEGDPANPQGSASSCDVFYVLDLRPLRGRFGPDDDVVLELSARFCDGRPEPGLTVTFICQMFLFEGEPSRVQPQWPLNLGDAVGSAAALMDSAGGRPGEWQSATSRCFLTPRADFAVVQLGARRNWPTVNLGLQYADQVTLILKSSPRRAPRAARHDDATAPSLASKS